MDILISGAQAMGIPLSCRQQLQFERYYDELIKWNEKINLTRITGYEDVLVKHFLDSLSLVPVMGDAASLEYKRVIDVGAGAGFPGI
ncbi:MAG: class I SAM-dependent methyltransferase, partial [Dehalococcoidales bacterium]|nr:class I SAM-dependent methyltransferase [Dehalococcoidales bacterium]